jgi:hypothetical protein
LPLRRMLPPTSIKSGPPAAFLNISAGRTL